MTTHAPNDWLAGARAKAETPEQIDIIEAFKAYIESFGGPEAFVQHQIDREQELNRHWEADADVIGRILRAHLYTEHFISEYLQFHNPALGSVKDARLTYLQKIDLLPQGDRMVFHFLPGLRRLNKVRNRVAHNMRGGVTADDVKIFESCPMYVPFVKVRGPVPEIDVLEGFSRFAARMLYSQCDVKSDQSANSAFAGMNQGVTD